MDAEPDSDAQAHVVERDLGDIAQLLGIRPRSWQEGETLFECFVLPAGAERDADLIEVFNRCLHRQRMLLEPVGSAMTAHLPLR